MRANVDAGRVSSEPSPASEGGGRGLLRRHDDVVGGRIRQGERLRVSSTTFLAARASIRACSPCPERRERFIRIMIGALSKRPLQVG